MTAAAARDQKAAHHRSVTHLRAAVSQEQDGVLLREDMEETAVLRMEHRDRMRRTSAMEALAALLRAAAQAAQAALFFLQDIQERYRAAEAAGLEHMQRESIPLGG